MLRLKHDNFFVRPRWVISEESRWYESRIFLTLYLYEWVKNRDVFKKGDSTPPSRYKRNHVFPCLILIVHLIYFL